MRTLKNILGVLLAMMVGIITFFTFNLLFSFVSNYEALSPTSFSMFPMLFFMFEIYTALFAVFNYVVLKRQDAYFWRKYSLIVAIFALVGVAFSILCGTYVYHTFVGDAVFGGYPLIMLIVHGALLCSSCYVYVTSVLKIKKENPERTWKNSKTYWLKELAIADLLMFGLEKFGAILLLPLFWSSYDSVYVIPFFIQLLMPLALFVTYMMDKHWKHCKKLNVIMYGSIFVYSVFSFVYMIAMAHGTYPLMVNSLSGILHFERLITKPIGFVVLYLVCFAMAGACCTVNLVKLIKEKKQAEK